MEQKTETYNIVVTSNDNYMNYTMVLFASMFAANREKHFHIFVLYASLDEGRMAQMADYVHSRGADIDFLYVEETRFDRFLSTVGRISIETYFRLQIQELLPADITRALYLDGDMIVCGDLSELYHTDFEGKYLAACGFSTLCEQGDEFNAGMILFNMEKMRKDITFDTYCELAERLNGKFYMDQGLLNAQFGKDGTRYVWKQKYNFTCPFYRKFEQKIRQEDPAFTLDDVVIVHFAGPGIRPWQAEFTDREIQEIGEKNLADIFAATGIILDKLYFRFLAQWWSYAADTPAYEELRRDMYRTKSEIFSEALFKMAHTTEYTLGYKLLKGLRRLKK